MQFRIGYPTRLIRVTIRRIAYRAYAPETARDDVNDRYYVDTNSLVRVGTENNIVPDVVSGESQPVNVPPECSRASFS